MTFIGNSLNQESIENIKKEGLPVIIFGAGIVGEVLFHACRNVGIKVECFCDNNINKTQSTKCNVKVIPVLNLKEQYKDANFLISAADIKDVADQLYFLGYYKRHAGSLLLRDFNLSQYQFSAPKDFVEYAVGASILCHDSYLTPDRLFLRSVDIIITERCSLKCRDCSNLMQYYKKPKDCNINELLKSIDVLCGIIDEVNEFRVIGGEPFLNKGCYLIIKRLIGESKVKRVVIYTNGTIIPKEDRIQCLKNSKVLIFITDYGIFSRKINDLIQVLQRNDIAFYVEKARGWTDCAGIIRHYRNIEQQKEIFKSCCAKNLITLSKGKLYRCPFSANADRLRAVPNSENDYIDIVHEPKGAIDVYKRKEEIRSFLLEKEFLEVCDYCKGRSFGDSEIQPAIQINRPLEYEEYLS